MNDFSEIPDIGMMVGVGRRGNGYPWPMIFAEEAKRMGPNKGIPRSAIPEIVPGVTHLVLYHPRARVIVTDPLMTLWDLALELYTEYVVEKGSSPHPKIRTPEGFVADNFDPIRVGLIDEDGERNTLGITILLDMADQAGELDRLIEKYGIEFRHGWFCYCPVTEIRYTDWTPMKSSCLKYSRTL